MFQRLALLALVALMTESAGASEEPSIAMHRTAACEPIDGGWCHARSTLGGFSVDMPMSFDDFSLPTEPLQTGGRGRAHVVKGILQGFKITAMCIEYLEGKPDAGVILDGIASGASKSRVLTHQGVEARWFAIGQPGSNEIGVAYVGNSFACVQTIDAQGEKSLPEKDQQRFFDSISLPVLEE